VASIIPLLILIYIYTQSSDGYSSLPTEVLSNTMLILLVGVFATYITMRAMIMKVLELSSENRRKLEILLGNKSMEEFVQEQNEIVKLRQSFAVVTQQLEQVLRNLESGKR
jgi:signal transduction histidine kinase